MRQLWRLPLWASLGLALALADAVIAAHAEPAMTLRSPAFASHAPIPQRHSCEGADVSPPLAWSNVPDTAESLALIVDDPDAPGRTWVHWVVYNLSPDPTELPADASGNLPGDAVEGENSWRELVYGGPCPPTGEHRYVHKLYALDTTLKLKRPDKQTLLEAMQGHVLEKAELVGTYEKQASRR